MTKHEIKILPEYFIPTANGNKAFEIRKNDRSYQRNDKLVMKEWNGIAYTGNEIHCTITFIFKGGKYGVAADHVILGIRLLNIISKEQ